METAKVLENCQKNLERGRAVATGIGVFAAVRDPDGWKILLRQREETDSLYGQDLSGKWELIGGGVEIVDFSEDYTEVILNCLKRELMEEAGLEFEKLWYQESPINLLPAWLYKNNLIDLAFVAVVPLSFVGFTPVFSEKIANNQLRYFNMEEVKQLNIVSARMRFLIERSFELGGGMVLQ